MNDLQQIVKKGNALLAEKNKLREEEEAERLANRQKAIDEAWAPYLEAFAKLVPDWVIQYIKPADLEPHEYNYMRQLEVPGTNLIVVRLLNVRDDEPKVTYKVKTERRVQSVGWGDDGYAILYDWNQGRSVETFEEAIALAYEAAQELPELETELARKIDEHQKQIEACNKQQAKRFSVDELRTMLNEGDERAMMRALGHAILALVDSADYIAGNM